MHAQDIGPQLLVAERVEPEDLLAVVRFRVLIISTNAPT
jgi:hypothetical protein